MAVSEDRRYLKSHEWHKLEGEICTIGITQFAADELTDVTFVSLPSTGKELTAGKPFGEIESVKATSDLISGVSGVVTAVNTRLNDSPELVNNDPLGDGWMIKVKLTHPSEYEKLLSPTDYQAQLGSH
ncbi:MAG: glycine cleavage system protein GcvH [Phycisphaerae bacterium]|nr:glycine cleavage system protein GcvH [Phycisphaerae bacterium]